MSAENEVSGIFSLPPLIVDRIDVALAEPKYMVTLRGQGRRLMIAPKIADVIAQLKQGKSLEEAARDLSEAWGREIGSEDLRFIIEQQMIPRGLAYVGDTAPLTPSLAFQSMKPEKRPIYARVLAGRFQWRLLGRDRVRKICSPLVILYEPLSIILAITLIAATRYMLYAMFDMPFLRQITARATPAEYLLTLALLLGVVLIHEFGHAAAQVRFGLNTGPIGFQLYHYIPAFFADVSNSWKLKSRQRIAIDLGGIYFQSIAASFLYVMYLKTDSIPFLAAAIASDVLCVIAINPLMKFDGYWLVADILAVPNLHEYSERVVRRTFAKLFGRPTKGPVPVRPVRAALLFTYAIVRNGFWLLLALWIVTKSSLVYRGASIVLSHFYSGILKGIETSDWALTFSSTIRMALFVLLLLTMLSLVFGVALKVAKLVRKALARTGLRKMSDQTIASPVQH
jgi:putative peptide zinc metalloprotease protein